jgi:hypothetical protein
MLAHEHYPLPQCEEFLRPLRARRFKCSACEDD